MASDPKLLLADEPTGNLDPETALEILQLLRTFHLRGTTVLLATHDPRLWQNLDARLVELDHGKMIGSHVESF